MTGTFIVGHIAHKVFSSKTPSHKKVCYDHSFETRLGPAGQIGPTVNRWVYRVELHFGSVMQLDRWKSVRLGETRTKPVTRPVFESDRFNKYLFQNLKKIEACGNRTMYFMVYNKELDHCTILVYNN